MTLNYRRPFLIIDDMSRPVNAHIYQKNFALFPTRLSDKSVIFWKSFYIKYRRYDFNDGEKISTQEFMFRKLADTL
jgi:hypothetical protein